MWDFTSAIWIHFLNYEIYFFKVFNNSDFLFAGSVLTDEVLVEAGTNVSIGCPGMTRNTFVVQLEWRCIGPCGSSGKTGQKPVKPESNADYADENEEGVEESQVKLLKYVKDQETSVFAERVRLDKEMFALQFDPVTDQVTMNFKFNYVIYFSNLMFQFLIRIIRAVHKFGDATRAGERGLTHFGNGMIKRIS